MSQAVVPSSFRDPAGFVWAEGDTLYRQVNDSYRSEFDEAVSSGLYEELVRDGLLIAHDEAEVGKALRPGAYKVLRPERVRFVSYPYEWCFGQLRDAALTTLEIQRRALDHGMSLRDASAYNIQFHRGRPVLIDTLSFERLREDRPWVAYRQFCRHFLAPLSLMAYRDLRLSELLTTNIDGLPLDLTACLLPVRTRLRPGLGIHVHMHARMERRHQSDQAARSPGRKMSLRAHLGLVGSLERAVRKLRTRSEPTEWGDYYETAHHYSQAAHEHKRELVARFLSEADGSVLWDLGANIGVFAREGARRNMLAICFDVDPACVEANYERATQSGEELILPLLCDLTNPSPGIGWAHRERAALVERGPADVVLALALVHHLVIGNNVPLELTAEFLAEVGDRLIVEFVPKSDPMVERLLATREDIFPDYTQEGFEAAFTSKFSIERQEPIRDSHRMLYLMRRI